MSTITYSTQKTFDGPWLIERNALRTLDETLDAIALEFARKAEAQIEIDLVKELEMYPSERREAVRNARREAISNRHRTMRRVRLVLSPIKYVEADSLGALLALPELNDESPSGLEAEIKSAGRSAAIGISRTVGGGAIVNVRTSPEKDQDARAAFVVLQEWAQTHQAPLWQRIWAHIGVSHWFLWGSLLVIATLLFVPSQSQSVESELRPAAVALVEGGISPAEVPKAIELLLRLEAKEPIGRVNRQLPAWYKWFFCGGLVTCIVLSIRPSLVIGIGRKAPQIGRWRIWMRLAFFTVPGLLFTSIVWPHLLAWFQAAS